MKKISVSALLAVLVFAAWAQRPEKKIAIVDYVEGKAHCVRAGKVLGNLAIGDEVFPDDMIRTTANSLVRIALDKRSGMKGTLTVKQNSVLYIRCTAETQTRIELISGRIASKLVKLADNSVFSLETDSASMSVSNGEFAVSAALTGSLLIVCTDGVVSCGAALTIRAGQAVQKRSGENFARIPVAASGAARFEQAWMSEEVEEFKANALRVISDYEKLYSTLFARFDAASAPLLGSEVLSKWIREDMRRLEPNPRDPSVMKEKNLLAPAVLATQDVLFIFERVYYRMAELKDFVASSALEQAELRPGYTVGAFLRRLAADAAGLEKRVHLYRYAQHLYGLRDNKDTGLPGMDFDSD